MIDDHLKLPLPARRDVGAVTTRYPVPVASAVVCHLACHLRRVAARLMIEVVRPGTLLCRG